MADDKTPTRAEEPGTDATSAPSEAAPVEAVVDEAVSDADEVSAEEAEEADEAADEPAVGPVAVAVGPPPVVFEGPAPEPPPDLAALGRRYEVSARFADELRAGFRELKRHPAEAKRLPALLRGLARAHEPEAQRAVQQLTQLIERIQAPAKDGA